MAEAAVVLALGKLVTSFGVSSLRTYLEKEPARLPDLPYTAKHIERELDMIHHFLSQVGTKIYSNKVLEGWIVRVRKVAYRVEDITDEYSYNIALEHENHFKRLIHKFFYPTAFHRIAIELKDIEEEIKHLSQLKRDYREMFNELLDNTSDSAHIHLLSSNGSPHAVKGDDIVGMKEDMELLGRWLDPKELDRTVISIWGFGGLGKTTLVRKKSNMECPSHLEELSRQIVNKCGGLPLAINAIGNVLAVQESKEIVWRRINNQFKCELEDNPGLDKVRSALSISFMYLPRHLKNCFLYCSMFPQDYIFKRELLIKLWIVEGFVIQRGQSTLEEVADGYFTELIQQSMMQLVENDEIGRVVSCRMHDIMRELALSFSRKERFGLADINLETQKKDDVRRLLVSNFDQVNQLIKSSMDLPRLRTFIAANRVANYQLLTLLISRCKYLAVLELRDSPLDKIPENIGDLFNLRYLGLRRTRIKSLPISIKKLTNLETLDLKSTNIERLPREVAKLKKLRHIFAEQLYDPEERQLRYFRGVKLPDCAFDLAQLQTLQTVEATKESVKLLKYLPELRLLCVENVCRADCATLFSSLSNMNHLYDLVISANDLNEPLDFNAFNPICTKLEKLTIRGCWDNETFRRPVFCEYGANIKYLTLTFCKNDTNPLPSISSSMPNLIFLSIRRGCWAEDIILRAGWFPQLRTLWLGKLEELRRLVIEEGAIIRLEVLLLLSLPSLREVPKGLELLASLKKLNVTMQHHELKVEWERDNWKTKLHHIQEIRF
ncbi:hypothetical protein OsI_06188 [Oryza sativa Indica Group]|uniref:Uncharacterized protein n=1 Tax=Oryza sativa subsp. indica TaxID=39946 RepID=B8AJ96_ORYSI|nr:hypothetical protein OsI_06188 [Oryza sativa Indica Group]